MFPDTPVYPDDVPQQPGSLILSNILNNIARIGAWEAELLRDFFDIRFEFDEFPNEEFSQILCVIV